MSSHEVPTKIFVTGIGTGIGKTVVSAILTEALQSDYWKPVQAGFQEGTDSEWVRSVISNEQTRIHPETYKLKLPASPHIAAREDGEKIDLDKIVTLQPKTTNKLVIEGAGGLMVPLNEKEFVSDLILKLDAKVILVSRNYLGSINHSLMTAMACKRLGIPVAAWIFNDHYLAYEHEVVQWTGIPAMASIPFCATPDRNFVKEQAEQLRTKLNTWPW